MQGRINGVENAGHILGEFGIPKADDTIAFAFEPQGSTLIAGGHIIIGVMAAIQFDDEARFQAGEICNIGANRRLPPEMTSVNGYVLQGAPQGLLRLGGV